MIFADHRATWTFDSSSDVYVQPLRAQFVSILHACGTLESDFFAAELIFGELLGNAVRHASGAVSVDLDWNDVHPVLTVHDEAKMFGSACLLPHDPLHESGRGLFIVKALALSLAFTDMVGDGSKVIAVLPVSREGDLPARVHFAVAPGEFTSASLDEFIAFERRPNPPS